MLDRASRGIRIAARRTFRVQWPGICKPHIHTRLSHYRSTRRRSDSASVMIRWRSYTLHPPACKTQSVQSPPTFAFHIKPLFAACRWTYARWWVGGGLQSSLSLVMTTRLPLLLWKIFYYFQRCRQYFTGFPVCVSCLSLQTKMWDKEQPWI